MKTTEKHPVDILIVEDNPGDARLMLEALKQGKTLSSFHIMKDGIEALKFLHKEGEYTEAPDPDLVFLDLNLPKKDGREVLREIKNDNALKKIPVVVMTISQADEDVINSYNLHANCYIPKPIDFNKFIKIIKSIEDFWFSTVKLPPKEKSHLPSESSVTTV